MNPASTTTADARRNGDKPFVISRVLPAPRDRVWRAWTDAAEMARWSAAGGSTMASCVIDLRPGGRCHYCLRTPDGNDMWGKWEIREVAAPERLLVVQSFSDALGGIAAHPMSPTWPREILSLATFIEREGVTTLTITWLVHDGAPEEHRTFDAAHDGMRQGWSSMLDDLAAYLAR
jgi:uncharacterized protein YndB with AHSA1/START domain